MYGSIEKDPILVSSFIGAIASLSREISEYGSLKSIEIPPYKIGAMQVMDTPQVVIAIAANLDFPDFALNRILGNIAEVFLNRFGDKILSTGTRDLTDLLKSDMHKAIMAGVQEASIPYDPANIKHRIGSLLKNATSPKGSCPYYDQKLRSKCKMDPSVFRVADCEGVAFSKGLPCAYATRGTFIKEAERVRRREGS